MVIVFQPQSQKLPRDFSTKLTLTICLHFVDLDFVMFGQAFDKEPFSCVIKEVILPHGFHSWKYPTLASSAMLFCFLRNFRKKKVFGKNTKCAFFSNQKDKQDIIACQFQT